MINLPLGGIEEGAEATGLLFSPLVRTFELELKALVGEVEDNEVADTDDDMDEDAEDSGEIIGLLMFEDREDDDDTF